ncbi:conserved hypothetical protein [Burkholderia vietnamiensis]|nr:conserved hypothetical protein [Burkholderia vietnamiensis]SOT46062.1 hypothetical protein F01_570048 [Burkholderia cenocepacia]
MDDGGNSRCTSQAAVDSGGVEGLQWVAKRLSHGSRTAARRRTGLFADLAERPGNEISLLITTA